MNARPARARSLTAAALVGAAVLLAAVLLILAGASHERSIFDQDRFHLKVIQRFSQQWPRFDFRDYESATTPGYHLALAAVHRFITPGPVALRIAGGLFTVGFLSTLAWWLGPRVGVARALALLLPLGGSLYVLFPGVWLLPDNAAWWALAALLLVLLGPVPTAGRAVLAASLLVLLVMVRQVHAWAALPLAVAWWLAWARERDDPVAISLMPPRGERAAAVRRLAVAGLACLPAAAVVILFAVQWGGLVPPAFQPRGSPLTNPDYTNVAGLSPATPAFILALIGILGTFFVGFVWRDLRRADWLLPGLVAAGLALAIAAIPRTDYALMPRISGLWNIVKAAPLIAGRTSPVIVLPAMLGGVWLVVWFRALPRREAWILAATLLGFVLAHTAGALTWQRYFEPMVLILLVLAAALAAARRDPPRWAWFGPIALGVLQAALTAAVLLRT